MSEAIARHAMPVAKKKRGGLYLKVGLAAGAACALLAGGAGTFAAWNSSTTISGGSVNTGRLAVSAPATAPTGQGWYDLTKYYNEDGSTSADEAPLSYADLTSAANTSKITSLGSSASSYELAPGDVLEYYTTVNVAAQGNNLKAQLAADTSALSLPSTVHVGVQFAPNNGTLTFDTGSGAATITWDSANKWYKIVTDGSKAANITNLPVLVTVQIPGSTTDPTPSQENVSNISLANLTVKLTQVFS